MSKRIAFFDFDGTITFKDTYLEFRRFAKGDVAFFTGFALNSPVMVAYVLKLIPNYWAKERMLTHYFKGMPIEDFQKVCDDFATKIVPKLIRPKAMEEIKSLQKGGVQIIIVSASFGNWIQKWTEAENLGLIATRAQIIDGRLTGKIDGKNCYGHEKVRRIAEVINIADYTEVLAYGDTAGDLPMLQLATTPFYKPFR